MRICSFLPSATEIVYLLGLGDSLHGVSHECDFPPDALGKPKVVRSRFDSENLSSGEIDRIVTDMMMRGENIYEVDADVLADARPDLVITQQLCEVCAISFEDVQHAVAALSPVPTVLSLDPHSIDDMLNDITRVGEHTGSKNAAAEVVAGLRARIDSVLQAAESVTASPTVACIEWLDPIIAAGHWVPEMVETAGGTDALVRPGSPSTRIDFAQLVEADPDVLVLMPCGMDVPRARSEFDALPDHADWRRLSAFQNDRAYAVDSGALFSRSGPRLVDGIELLARILHPELFDGPPCEPYASRPATGKRPT